MNEYNCLELRLDPPRAQGAACPTLLSVCLNQRGGEAELLYPTYRLIRVAKLF